MSGVNEDQLKIALEREGGAEEKELLEGLKDDLEKKWAEMRADWLVAVEMGLYGFDEEYLEEKLTHDISANIAWKANKASEYRWKCALDAWDTAWEAARREEARREEFLNSSRRCRPGYR